MAQNLAHSIRQLLRLCSRLQPELRAAVWLSENPQGYWITAQRVTRRAQPPRLAAGSGTALPDWPGSFIRCNGHEACCELLEAIRLVCASDQQRQRGDQLGAIWETAVDAMISIDERGLILALNPATEKLFGYSRRELLGANVSKLMPRPHRQDHDAYLGNYLASGQAKIIGIGRKVPAQRKDGRIFPAHLSVSEFYLYGRRYFTGILRDISDVVEARTRAAVEERRHLSRELHDSVSQALFGIVLGTQAARQAANRGAVPQLNESLDYVLSLAESGLAEMRALMFELRPESLEAEGLLISLRRQALALAKRYELRAEFEFPESEPQLSVATKHEIYRFVMEALHNVVKHARAQTFWVRIESDPRGAQVHATVGDDGIGFDPQAVPAGHVGLQSMRERVASLGGTLGIESKPGGTWLRAVFAPGQVESETSL